MKHQLTLETPDTNNRKIFRVFDTSIYSKDLRVTCGLLQITSPGFNAPVQLEVLPYFNLVLNACSLGITTAGCNGDAPELPDGIYNAQYSVAPNDKVYVEYNHLRITNLMNCYMEQLGILEINVNNDPAPEVKSKLKELRFIRSLIEAAKAKVEYRNACHQGMELYTYAQKRLRKYTGECINC